MRVTTYILLLALFVFNFSFAQTSNSIPKKWSEALLFSIRNDFARPPVHARNLYHLSLAMHDAWASYEPGEETLLLGKTYGAYYFDYSGVQPEFDSAQIVANQEMAISYAAYRLIRHRFVNAPGAFFIYQYLDSLMNDLGYDVSIMSTSYISDGPAALGNYIAQEIINFGLQDGSNESGNYVYQYYTPANPPVAVEQPGNPTMVDPNRWQPITLSNPMDQAGNPLPSTPKHLGPEWGNVVPFALEADDITYHVRDGHTYQVYHDPGVPPFFDTLVQTGMEDFFKWNYVLVSIWQSHQDPNDPTLWDISPGAMGNITSYPNNWSEYDTFYDLYDGGDSGNGHPINPITGSPYTPQIVKRADYARVLAEFWADGIDSETPPGHWFDIYNHVSEHPLFERKWKGVGPVLSEMDYDVKAYVTLGGAMHDAAISAWGIKGWYDSPRPVSIIRYMAEKGQSTDNMAPNYHPAGIPLVPGFVETVEVGDPLAGASNEHVGKIKLYTWRGHDYIVDPETDYAGVGWILAENWWPYQRPSFVSPPFAGYVSGHSTYSSAAAEVMSFITGSPYFPGGIGEFVAEQNEFLEFEEGPTETIVLQWATYKDAADQCSLSRIWGGIHPPVDDIPGRVIGQTVGNEATYKADSIFSKKRPTIVDWTSNISVINENSIGSQLVLQFEYDSTMNITYDPQVSFLENDPVGTSLDLISSNWLNDHSYEMVFNIEPTILEMDSIYISIDSAISVSSIVQKPVSLSPLFIIDTKKPEVENVLSNMTFINTNSDGAQLIIDIEFTEPCQNTAPLLDLDPIIPIGCDLVLNPSSMWLSDTVYQAVFDIDILAESVESVDIMLSAVWDVAGNEIISNSVLTTVTVDTDLPGLFAWNDNMDSINMWDLGSNLYVIDLTFDKNMSTSFIPPIEFLDNTLTAVSVPLIVNSNSSQWISSTELQISLDIISHPTIELDNIQFSVLSATDASGNSVTDIIVPINLTIDNVRPEVLSATPMHTVINETVYTAGEAFVDFAFNESMDQIITPQVLCIKDQNTVDEVQFDPFNSYWIDAFTYRAHFNLPSFDFSLAGVGVELSYGQDTKGNYSIPFESGEIMDIDYTIDNASLIELGNGFKIYPNPIRLGDVLKIESYGAMIRQINLTDMYGKTVDQIIGNGASGVVSIDLNEEWSAGVYFLSILFDEGWIENKIIITE